MRRPTGPILLSCLGVDLELVLLPHFLAHYAALGVAPGRIHVLLNTTDPASPRLAEAEAVLAALGAPPPRRWIAPCTSEAMWQERRDLFGTRLGALARADDPRFRLRFPFRVWHYKWNGLRRDKIDRRVATPGASAADLHFGASALDYLARHGRIRLPDVVTGDPVARVRAWKALALWMRLEARYGIRQGATRSASRDDGTRRNGWREPARAA